MAEPGARRSSRTTGDTHALAQARQASGRHHQGTADVLVWAEAHGSRAVRLFCFCAVRCTAGVVLHKHTFHLLAPTWRACLRTGYELQADRMPDPWARKQQQQWWASTRTRVGASTARRQLLAEEHGAARVVCVCVCVCVLWRGPQHAAALPKPRRRIAVRARVASCGRCALLLWSRIQPHLPQLLRSAVTCAC
jgi:hypothetical protein